MSSKRALRAREFALLQLSTALSPLQRGYRAAADKAVAHVGLSQALAWPLLMIGRVGPGTRPGVLAHMLGIEGPSLGRSLTQLTEAGLIEIREDTEDRRAKTLHLTEAGEAARTQIEDALLELRNSVYADINDADIAACLRVFGVLQQRLGCAMPDLLGSSAPPAKTGAR
jgi:MarR family transcriptional regulator for hemolysin